jgi:hypothetical protein
LGPGHLIQRPQQPEPAGKAHLQLCSAAVSAFGTGDYAQATGRRLHPVKDDSDLHCPIVPAAQTANIRQPADVCDAGEAARSSSTPRLTGTKSLAGKDGA